MFESLPLRAGVYWFGDFQYWFGDLVTFMNSMVNSTVAMPLSARLGKGRGRACLQKTCIIHSNIITWHRVIFRLSTRLDKNPRSLWTGAPPWFQAEIHGNVLGLTKDWPGWHSDDLEPPVVSEFFRILGILYSTEFPFVHNLTRQQLNS